MSKNERVISDPAAAGWEFDPDTGYWMWKGEEGTGGGLWEQNGDDIYYNDGNVGIGGDVLLYNVGKEDRGLKITGDNSLGFDGSTWTFDATANNTGSALVFKTRRGEAMRIDSNGNVGIGESSPSLPLHITSNNNTGPTSQILIQNKGGGVGATVEMRLCPSAYSNDIGSTARWSAIRGINEASGNATGLSFLTNSTSADPVERMRIDADGNVGIGADAPKTKLDISTGSNEDSGPIAIRLGVSAVNSRSAEIVKDTTTRDFEFHAAIGGSHSDTVFYSNDTTERMRIAANGDVSLGGVINADYALRIDQRNNGSAGGLFINAATRTSADGATRLISVVGGDSLGEVFGVGVDGTVNGTRMLSGGHVVATAKDIIETLVTLRKATMDETQDIRESLRDAIDELVAGFEQEIAAMPAPEPTSDTMDIKQ